MSERTTVRLPADLLERAKQKASGEGRTLNALIEEGLRLVVAQELVPPSASRILPRARATPRSNTGSSGLLPGVDLDQPAVE
jgi:hypothetical protein